MPRYETIREMVPQARTEYIAQERVEYIPQTVVDNVTVERAVEKVEYQPVDRVLILY